MPFPLLYEINTRCWLNALSDRQGRRITLATVPDSEFTRWQQLGFTHLWLMGAWASGPRSRAAPLAGEELQRKSRGTSPGPGPEEIAGSPYAIADYSVPQTLGGEPALQEFRRRLHLHGMKLILDFVPNHVGLDHRWVSERPELFVRGPAGMPGTFAAETRAGVLWLAHGKDPNFPPWTDTVQLDYRRPATRAAMLDILLGIADRCDGLRCDMAMLVLNEVFGKTWARFPPQPGRGHPPNPDGAGIEFWQNAIAATKRVHPDFLFLGEVYWGREERLQSLGFDYTYDKELYDELIQHKAAGVQRRVVTATSRFIAASAHFLENHDEPRIASLLSLAEHRAAALLILGLPGMRLLHDGQLEGARLKTPVQLSRWRPEPHQSAVARMYRQLLLALPKTAVGRGNAVVLKPRTAGASPRSATISTDFVLVQWQAEPPDFDLVVIHLAARRGRCCVPLRIAHLADHNWLAQDLLGAERRRHSGGDLEQQGLPLNLPGHGARLLHFRPGT